MIDGSNLAVFKFAPHSCLPNHVASASVLLSLQIERRMAMVLNDHCDMGGSSAIASAGKRETPGRSDC